MKKGHWRPSMAFAMFSFRVNKKIIQRVRIEPLFAYLLTLDSGPICQSAFFEFFVYIARESLPRNHQAQTLGSTLNYLQSNASFTINREQGESFSFMNLSATCSSSQSLRLSERARPAALSFRFQFFAHKTVSLRLQFIAAAHWIKSRNSELWSSRPGREEEFNYFLAKRLKNKKKSQMSSVVGGKKASHRDFHSLSRSNWRAELLVNDSKTFFCFSRCVKVLSLTFV